jgi:hypothetical protein
MALSQAQRLKRKANKTKARTEKAKIIQQESHLRYLSKWPIIAAYAPFNARDDYTMQYALIVRQRPNGQYAVGIFLIDTLCLGVKNCFMRVIRPHQLPSLLEKIEAVIPTDVVSPSYAATFVHKALEYARSLGFEPQGDYQVVKQFLEGIPLDPSLTFTFGKDGKPVYIEGSRDSTEFVDNILEKLDNAVGRDHYKFVAPLEGEED